MPLDSTPRITPGLRSTPVPGTWVPGGAKTPTRPVRAADHLHLLGRRALRRVDRDAADAQPVGIRVLRRLDDARDAEGTERVRGILDAFDLEAEIGQGLGALVEAGLGLEMVLEPGEGELHGTCSVDAKPGAPVGVPLAHIAGQKKAARLP